MQHYRSLQDAALQNGWLTIGVFDGVHRGHQEILKTLTAGAHANGAPAIALTFDPHPASVLSEREIKNLTTIDERAELFARYGVDVVITQRFTRDLAAVSARDYMSRLKENLGLRCLLIGYDFALGKNREGNSSRLAEIGNQLGFDVQVIPALSDESGVISSTEIRKLISTGNVAEALNLLGRPYSLGGDIVHGDGRGRSINVPTANVNYPREKLIPARGIYACWAWVDGEKHSAAVNIGFNPTFTPDKQTATVEAHLLDFEHDLYGREIKLDFMARLRDEMKFPSVEALLDQIHRDVEQTRSILESR